MMIFAAMSWTACSDFLDAKPQKNLVIPNSLDDFQAILDAEPRYMNAVGSFALIGADDIFIGPQLFDRIPPQMQAVYLWQEEVFLQDEQVDDWNVSYHMIYNANVVLDGLQKYEPINEADRIRSLELEAAAKFSRAFGHFTLMQLFAPPYIPGEPSQDGIPMRITADINVATGVATSKEVYDLILSDLEFASMHLPDKAAIQTRASRWASESLLSRIYLVLQEYGKAFLHAEEALGIDDTLMDFNALPESNAYTFPRFNPEVIHQVNVVSSRLTFNPEQFVNPDLYQLYDSLDLRKTVLFDQGNSDGFHTMVSRYSGDFYDFAGLAVDEVLLNYAEAAVRIGEDQKALEGLNRLLVNRYKKGAFSDEESMGEELLVRILEERRKELLFRGIRWMDLRRLNQEPQFAVTLDRKYNGLNVELEPNGKGYSLPIPPLEVQLNPGLD